MTVVSHDYPDLHQACSRHGMFLVTHSALAGDSPVFGLNIVCADGVQMDADYDPSQQPAKKKKKKKEREDNKKKKKQQQLCKDDVPLMGKKRKMSPFAEVISKSKPVFDPRKS